MKSMVVLGINWFILECHGVQPVISTTCFSAYDKNPTKFSRCTQHAPCYLLKKEEHIFEFEDTTFEATSNYPFSCSNPKVKGKSLLVINAIHDYLQKPDAYCINVGKCSYNELVLLVHRSYSSKNSFIAANFLNIISDRLKLDVKVSTPIMGIKLKVVGRNPHSWFRNLELLYKSIIDVFSGISFTYLLIIFSLFLVFEGFLIMFYVEPKDLKTFFKCFLPGMTEEEIRRKLAYQQYQPRVGQTIARTAI